ncbi:MAG: DUF2726 domain-containing protein [Pirellulales bacterium]|nr:DUF2726 domain-containing protein [Pirellulales bacterium]
MPYFKRGPLLSRGEMAFYRVLRKAVGRRFHIAFKVRLADLVTCSEQAWAAGFGHMIARHHIDFVLCDYRSMDVVAAIELDDRSHRKPCRRRRDAFLAETLFAASIPLIRICAAAWYDASLICALVRDAVEEMRVGAQGR